MVSLTRYHRFMGHFSVRIDDDLHHRVREAASHANTSLNGYVTRVLCVATEPSPLEPEADRIRARLAAAGLLSSAEPPAEFRLEAGDRQAFEDARRRSGDGTSGSALIAAERRGR